MLICLPVNFASILYIKHGEWLATLDWLDRRDAITDGAVK